MASGVSCLASIYRGVANRAALQQNVMACNSEMAAQKALATRAISGNIKEKRRGVNGGDGAISGHDDSCGGD